MKNQPGHEMLERVDRLERELEQLKRDLIRSLPTMSAEIVEEKPSLFGSVRGGDVSEELIEEAKQELFRDLKDLSSEH